jgi:hypothetical protein
LRFVFKKHIKKSDNINLKKYSLYITYVEEDKRAAGGSTILVRDNILHSYANLNTHQQAVAVRITLDKTITLCFGLHTTYFSTQVSPTQTFI